MAFSNASIKNTRRANNRQPGSNPDFGQIPACTTVVTIKERMGMKMAANEIENA